MKRRAEGILSLAVGLAGLYFSASIAEWFSSLGPSALSSLFQGMLGWASIEAGFLFAAYTFIAAGSSTFIVSIQSTRAFIDFKDYIIFTLYLSFAVSGVALYFSIAPPNLGIDGYGRYIIVFFIAASAWIVLRFLKIVRVFRKIDKAKPPDFHSDPEFEYLVEDNKE